MGDEDTGADEAVTLEVQDVQIGTGATVQPDDDE